jgi:hypothetical protein
LKCGFQNKVCASKSPTFFSRKPLGASKHDHNMTVQTNFKMTADQPLANAYFGTFAFRHRDRQTPQNAKEPKFSSRTATAHVLSTVSVLLYTFPTTSQQNRPLSLAELKQLTANVIVNKQTLV